MLEPVNDSIAMIDGSIDVISIEDMLVYFEEIQAVYIENRDLKILMNRMIDERNDAEKFAIVEKGRNNAMMQESVEQEELNKNKIKGLTDLYKQWQAKVAQLLKEVDNFETLLAQEKSESTMKIDELQARIKALEKDKRDLKSEARDLQSEMNNVLAWNKELSRDNSTLRKRIGHMRFAEEQRLARENDSTEEPSDIETEDVVQSVQIICNNFANEKSEKRPSSAERNCTSPSQREPERHNYARWSRSSSYSSNDEPPIVQNVGLSIQEEIRNAERNMPVITPISLQEDTTERTSTNVPVVQFLDEVGLVSYMH